MDLHWVEALLLVERGHGWYHRIYRVHNHPEDGLWAVFGASLDEALRDASIDGEEVVAGHAWLARNASRNQDEVASREGLGYLVLWLWL